MRSNAVFNFKKLLLSLSVCAAILAPTANADNAMRNIFNGMMTSTSPATFSTATRTGIVGGSMSYRTTNVNTNLVSMSFPKLLSVVTVLTFSWVLQHDQRGPACAGGPWYCQGAAIYAFNVAVSAICADCAATINDIKTNCKR